jgi:hypothetical protein
VPYPALNICARKDGEIPSRAFQRTRAWRRAIRACLPRACRCGMPIVPSATATLSPCEARAGSGGSAHRNALRPKRSTLRSAVAHHGEDRCVVRRSMPVRGWLAEFSCHDRRCDASLDDRHSATAGAANGGKSQFALRICRRCRVDLIEFQRSPDPVSRALQPTACSCHNSIVGFSLLTHY